MSLYKKQLEQISDSVFFAEFARIRFFVSFNDDSGSFFITTENENSEEIEIADSLLSSFVRYFELENQAAARMEAHKEYKEYKALEDMNKLDYDDEEIGIYL